METAVAMSKRILSHKHLLELMLESDENPSDENPFNSYTKIQVILNKAKSHRNIEWCLYAVHLVCTKMVLNGSKIPTSRYKHFDSKVLVTRIWILRYDGWKNGHLGADMLTWRGINNALHGRGTCDLFVGQLELREYLFAKVVPFLEAVVQISFNFGMNKDYLATLVLS